LVAEGASDQAIADRIGVSRMAISRHRRGHLMKAAQARLAIVAKGAEPIKERQQLAAAAASDASTPEEFVAAYFGLKAQAAKIDRIEARLERVATIAENAGSPGAVVTVAAQQLRAVETGAKLASTGGFAPPKTAPGAGAQFSLVMHFGDGRDIVIGGNPVDSDAIPGTGESFGAIDGTLVLPELVGATNVPDLEGGGDDDADYEVDV
jgi:hypothetical protein